MARPLRKQFPGAWYHVMNRGSCKADVFLDDRDRSVFLDLLGRACAVTDAEIHAYSLMGNHFHLVVRTPNANMDVAMRLLSGRYARYFNDRYGRDGGLCRGRYKAILIDSERYLLAVSRYVHRNPLAFWHEPLEDYLWSSYATFLGLRPAQVWLETSETLELVGGASRYRSLVESPLPSEIDRLYQRRNLPSVLGSADFKELVRAKAAKGV